jgi:hypothetical protein
MTQTSRAPWEICHRLAWAAMPPLAQGVAQEFEESLRAISRRRALAQYDVGMLIQQVMADPDTFGENAVEQLAEYLHIEGGAQQLREACEVATTFSRKFIKEQANIPTSTGNFLDFQDFVALAKIASQTMRMETLRCIREDDCSVTQIRQLVRQR